jgi:hypothetical protein
VNTFFLEVEKDKVAAVGLGRDLIDVSVGIADLQPEPVVIERLRVRFTKFLSATAVCSYRAP